MRKTSLVESVWFATLLENKICHTHSLQFYNCLMLCHVCIKRYEGNEEMIFCWLLDVATFEISMTNQSQDITLEQLL